jgi:hypothetical protein
MLTGDNERTAKRIASTLGIERFHAGVTPQEKHTFITSDEEAPASVVGSPKQRRHRLAAVGDRHRAGAVHQFLARIDAQGGVDRGVEIDQRHGILDGLLGEFVGDAVGAAVLQPPPASTIEKAVPW